MELQKIECDFTICKIADIGQADFTGEFVFLQKTPDEISLVCESAYVPRNAAAAEPGWKALKISGILDFGLVGVIAKIANILADAKISIFAISTYNTDYILMKADDYGRGIRELIRSGYAVK